MLLDPRNQRHLNVIMGMVMCAVVVLVAVIMALTGK